MLSSQDVKQAIDLTATQRAYSERGQAVQTAVTRYESPEVSQQLIVTLVNNTNVHWVVSPTTTTIFR